MEMMYAALLLHKAGQKIEEEGMKKVLEAAGANADAGRIKAVVSALEGANIEDLIAKAAMISAAPAAAAPAAAAPAAKKEEKDEKKTEEDAAAGLAGLFG